MNPLYQMLMQNMPSNNVMQFMQRFAQFRQNFQGDPREMVMKIMQQNPQRYNQAVMMAQQLQSQIPAFGAQDVSIQ